MNLINSNQSTNIINDLTNVSNETNTSKKCKDTTVSKRTVSGSILVHHDQLQKEHLEQKPRKKRLESMSDEEIIEENLKELLEKKKVDQKANGRRIACVVAMLLVFMAIYHAWIRKSAMLAGALVPAFIMLAYGGWVIILAKRDKEKRALFEKHVEEVTQKNKEELLQKSKLKKRKEKLAKQEKATMLNIINELHASTPQAKRPSFRQKFFHQNAPTSLTTVANIHQLATTSLFSPALAFGTGVDITPHVNLSPNLPLPSTTLQKESLSLKTTSIEMKPSDKKQLPRMPALPLPYLGRLESTP